MDGGLLSIWNTDLYNSTLLMLNSSRGGMNINYGSHVTFNDSDFIISGFSGTSPAFVVGYRDGSSSLTLTGSSRIETPAASSYDNGGYYTSTSSEYVVLGGSVRVKYASGSAPGVSSRGVSSR